MANILTSLKPVKDNPNHIQDPVELTDHLVQLQATRMEEDALDVYYREGTSFLELKALADIYLHSIGVRAETEIRGKRVGTGLQLQDLTLVNDPQYAVIALRKRSEHIHQKFEVAFDGDRSRKNLMRLNDEFTSQYFPFGITGHAIVIRKVDENFYEDRLRVLFSDPNRSHLPTYPVKRLKDSDGFPFFKIDRPNDKLKVKDGYGTARADIIDHLLIIHFLDPISTAQD